MWWRALTSTGVLSPVSGFANRVVRGPRPRLRSSLSLVMGISLLFLIPGGSMAVAEESPSQAPSIENGYGVVCIFDDAEEEPIWTDPADSAWHITDRRSLSGDHSYWYGYEELGTYSPGGAIVPNSAQRQRALAQPMQAGGAKEYGALLSPVYEIEGMGEAEISFWYWREVEFFEEGSYDRTSLQVRSDEGAWETVWFLDSTTWSEAAWIPVGPLVIPLPYGSQSVQFRFVFDTVDLKDNEYRGWFLDDIEICIFDEPPCAWPVEPPMIEKYGDDCDGCFEIYPADPADRIYYTLDGSEPTQQSLPYQGEICYQHEPGECIQIRSRSFRDLCPPSEVTSLSTCCRESGCAFEDDMEAGQNWSTTGLWHRSDEVHWSHTHAQWFADPSSGTYGPAVEIQSLDDINAARAVRDSDSIGPNSAGGAYGELISPPIPVGGVDAVELAFWHWREVEYYTGGIYDKTYVQVRFDRGVWLTVWSRDSRDPSLPHWDRVLETVDVPYGVSEMQVRFVFDTVDRYGNNYLGWIIDDVSVCGGSDSRVLPPEFWPPIDWFDCPDYVTLSCPTPGATIRFTLDGSEPTETSTVYLGPIYVDGYTTIKAKAFRSGLEPSATATETYVCEPAQCWIEMITAESDWQTSGFWHLEDYYGAGWDMVYWFRDPATGTYENPPGRAFGALSLPEIDVSGWDGSILEFYHWREVEAYAAGYDRTYVEVRFDNGPWETVWEKDSADESGFFATEWVNLTPYMPYGASTLRIRFVFDSIDAFANHFGGWIIDDVFVCPDEYWILGVPEVEDEPTIEAVCQPSPIRDVNTATFFVKGVEADAIRVEIFDLAGTLVFSSEDMGDEIVWHTESDYGEYLANGIYLFRMTALVDGEWMACGEPEKLVILR